MCMSLIAESWKYRARLTQAFSVYLRTLWLSEVEGRAGQEGACLSCGTIPLEKAMGWYEDVNRWEGIGQDALVVHVAEKATAFHVHFKQVLVQVQTMAFQSCQCPILGWKVTHLAVLVLSLAEWTPSILGAQQSCWWRTLNSNLAARNWQTPVLHDVFSAHTHTLLSHQTSLRKHKFQAEISDSFFPSSLS